MKSLAIFALLIISTAIPCTAQQQETREKRRPGFFLVWGPVHVIRDERANVTDVNGKLAEGPRIPTSTITYSEDGTQQGQIFYTPDGAIAHKRGSIYDPDGRLLETSDFNSKGDLQFRSVKKFDSRKKLIEEVMYRPDGSIFRRRTLEYQANPGITESTIYDQNGAIISKSAVRVSGPLASTSETFLFDSGRTIRTDSAFSPTPNGGQVYERRQNGGLLDREEVTRSGKDGSERVIYNTDGTIKRKERLALEYDSHHNVIKTVRSAAEGDSTDFRTVEIRYRTIEYY